MNRPERLTGAEVLALRQKLKMTQQVFADTLGISEVIISRWENNHHRPSHVLSAALRRLQAEQTPRATGKAVQV